MPDEPHERPMFRATGLSQGARLVPCHTDPIGAKGCAASSSSALFYRRTTGEGAWPLVVHRYRQALPGKSIVRRWDNRVRRWIHCGSLIIAERRPDRSVETAAVSVPALRTTEE
jgi:hypothetical protein